MMNTKERGVRGKRECRETKKESGGRGGRGERNTLLIRKSQGPKSCTKVILGF